MTTRLPIARSPPLAAASLALALLTPPALLAQAAAPCPDDGRTLCLRGGRFQLTVSFDVGAGPVEATASPLSDATGAFWYFAPSNLELVVKVLDGRVLNGSHWLFLGALTDVPFELTARDTVTGTVRSWFGEAGALAAVRDVDAFPEAPSAVVAAAAGVRAPAAHHLEETGPTNESAEELGHTHCDGGRAGPYPCREVDLMSFVPLARLGLGAEPAPRGNDVWGWSDRATGREWALMGLTDGVAFVDVTAADAPRVVGLLPTQTVSSTWRDTKVYRDHAYVVADAAQDHGLQVFDLRRLRGAAPGAVFSPDRVYDGFGSAHNVAIDEASGFAYVLGSDACAGGLHMLDLAVPGDPRFAGCFAEDGYTHDAQCVVYRGPSARHRGRQLCFAANEDTLTVVDVTDKARPELLARLDYPGRAYVHQGWLTEDHRWLLIDDEGDERVHGHPTRTWIVDVRDPAAPSLVGFHQARSPAIDHNQYVRGNLVFQANYRSGLRILDLSRVGRARLEEVGFFDTVPEDDAPGFSGAWSVYPFFASGNVLVSTTDRGLFVVRPRLPGLGLLAAPTALAAEVVVGAITLTWNDADPRAGARVYRSAERVEELLLAEVPHGVGRFVDATVDGLTTYRYRLAAGDGHLEGGSSNLEVESAAAPGVCVESPAAACLQGGRFRLEVAWRDAAGVVRPATLDALGDETAQAWFFEPDNVELLVKVLDATAYAAHYWMFYGALSDLAYTVTVTDTANGRVRRYANPAGSIAGRADTAAFPEP
ncbi:MAG TPA: choice-of-anchor B family protein [Thermoanaerobaculia bacterium]|nr:choice-of-anchor B family protein [Thermoanaerobaculia bacterium]